MALSRRVRRRLEALGVAIATAIVLALACSAVVFAATASVPATAAPHIPYPKCFGTGTGVELTNHIAYECLGIGGTDQGVGVYWSDNLYELNYYWHPDHGGIVINETFFKSCHEVSLERHGAPCGLYDNVPVTDSNPGANSYANGRLIWFADGCIVSAPTDTSAVPTQCSAVILDGGRSVAPARALTAQEADSLADYWSIMKRYTPDAYW